MDDSRLPIINTYNGKCPVLEIDASVPKKDESKQTIQSFTYKETEETNQQLSNSETEPITSTSTSEVSKKERMSHLQQSLRGLSEKFKANMEEVPASASTHASIMYECSASDSNFSDTSSCTTTSHRKLPNEEKITNSGDFVASRRSRFENVSKEEPSTVSKDKLFQARNIKRWGSGIANAETPYRRTRTPLNTAPLAEVTTVTVSSPPPYTVTANVSVSSNTPAPRSPPEDINYRRHSRIFAHGKDEEAEAERKKRSAKARRERRSTQGVTREDIKAAEHQIKSREGLPPTGSFASVNTTETPISRDIECKDIETDKLQRWIEQSKDSRRRSVDAQEEANLSENYDNLNYASKSTKSDAVSPSLSTNYLSNNLKAPTSATQTNSSIVEETKEVEIRSPGDADIVNEIKRGPESLARHEPVLDLAEKKDDQAVTSEAESYRSSQSAPPYGTTRSRETAKSDSYQWQPLRNQSSEAEDYKLLFEKASRINDENLSTIAKLKRELYEKDQLIDKLKSSSLYDSSIEKREKMEMSRRIAELEEDVKKLETLKADNARLKEENAALIRVISKLSK